MDATSSASRTSQATRTTRLSTPRLVLALALAAPLAFGLAFAGPGFFVVFPPVVIVSAAGALVAFAALFVDRRWMAIVGAVAAVLVFAMGASDPTPGALTRPSLGLQMSWGHAARFAGLVGLLAGIAEFRRARSIAPTRFARSVPLVATLALGLTLGVGATTQAALVDPGFAQGGTVVALAPESTVRIVEKASIFAVEGRVAPGSLVEIVVENQDDFIHSFTAEGIDVENLGGSTTRILARAPATSGDWTFVCKYHPGMDGIVRVA